MSRVESSSMGDSSTMGPTVEDRPVDELAAQTETLSLDVIFDVLKNQRRRHVIQQLKSESGTVDLGTLAERIAALENDKSVAEISYDERKRVYVALYQCHLPKMDEMGIVSFDQSRGSVELSEQAAELDPFLDVTTDERHWYQYYLAIALGGLAMLGVTVATGGTGLFSPWTVLVLVLGATSVCASYHAWQTRK